jgi:uncharacterized protein (TIGR02678 family)
MMVDSFPPADDSAVSAALRPRAARRLDAGTRLRDAAQQLEWEEKQRALRTLLMQPILPAAGHTADAYRLVWRHAAYLRDWLTRMAGWTLVLQGDLARLRKTPEALDDCTRGAVEPSSQQALTRRRYGLLCVVLAVLESEERQTTLGQIAERTQLLAGADRRLQAMGFDFDLKDQDSRRDLVCVIRFLASLQALSRDDGDDQQFIHRTGDALYRIHRPVLASLLCVRRPPSILPPMPWEDRLPAVHQTDLPDSDEAQNRELRHRVVRRLLDQPVLYFDELTEHEMAYLANQRSYLLGEIIDATGLVPEIRKEGIALLDPIGDCSDMVLPEAGTRGHATLLVAQWLAERQRSGLALAATWTEVDGYMEHLAREHAGHWRRGVDQPAVRQALGRDVIFQLEALGLVEASSAGVRPRAAIARYALGTDA